MILSPCTVAPLTAVQGECWSKPAKYFTAVKVLVSPPYSFSSGGPDSLKKTATENVKIYLNKLN